MPKHTTKTAIADAKAELKEERYDSFVAEVKQKVQRVDDLKAQLAEAREDLDSMDFDSYTPSTVVTTTLTTSGNLIYTN